MEIVVAYKIVNVRKLDIILKYGLNPKKTIDIFDDDNFRNYFLANVYEDKIKQDIKDIIEEIHVFKNNKSILRVIKLDLNKLKENHKITIETFIDPRMQVKCYWTGQFITPSCIEDVTEEYLDDI